MITTTHKSLFGCSRHYRSYIILFFKLYISSFLVDDGIRYEQLAKESPDSTDLQLA